MRCYDAVISGAGPAGCSAALSLARKGHRVLLLDKARFPREKTCGDGVTTAGFSMLEELGVIGLLRHRHGSLAPFNGVILSSPSGRVVHGRIVPTGSADVISSVIPRRELDDALVARVRDHSEITLLEDTRVEDLVMEGGMVRGVKSSAGEFSGRVIIGADGVYSVIAARLGFGNTRRNRQGFAIRAFFSGVEGLSDSIELHYDREMIPGYGWIFPVGEQRANVGVFLMTRYQDRHDVRRLFEQFVSRNEFAQKKLKRAMMEPGTLRAWPLPFGFAEGQRGKDNVLLAGDAGSFIDPLTGEGISYALKTGRYAAEATVSALEADDERQALPLYEKLWRKEFAFRVYSIGYAVQPLLNNRHFMDALIRFMGRKQSRADLMVQVIAHKRPRRDLLKVLNPFF